MAPTMRTSPSVPTISPRASLLTPSSKALCRASPRPRPCSTSTSPWAPCNSGLLPSSHPHRESLHFSHRSRGVGSFPAYPASTTPIAWACSPRFPPSLAPWAPRGRAPAAFTLTISPQPGRPVLSRRWSPSSAPSRKAGPPTGPNSIATPRFSSTPSPRTRSRWSESGSSSRRRLPTTKSGPGSARLLGPPHSA